MDLSVWRIAAIGLLCSLCTLARAESTPGWVANPAGLRLAASAYLEEISDALLGRKSPLTFREALLLARLGAAASAKQYAADFDAGETVVNDKYRGRRLLLTGAVRKRSVDATGKVSLSLAAQAGGAEVLARLETDPGRDEALLGQPGQRVALVCQAGIKTPMRTTAQQCQMLYQHMESLRPQVTADIEQFLAGRTAWPEKTGEGIAFFYALGRSLKPGAPCLRFPHPQCPDLESALRNDPELASELRRQMVEVKRGLRFSPP